MDRRRLEVLRNRSKEAFEDLKEALHREGPEGLDRVFGKEDDDFDEEEEPTRPVNIVPTKPPAPLVSPPLPQPPSLVPLPPVPQPSSILTQPAQQQAQAPQPWHQTPLGKGGTTIAIITALTALAATIKEIVEILHK